MSSVFADYLRQAPPVSRVIAGLTFLTSLLVYVFGVLSIDHIFFHGHFIFKTFPPQIWRLVSSFLLTGPKMGILMDTFFLYRDASECEKRFTRTGDFFVFTVFVGSVILILNYLFVGGFLFVAALNLAYAYYWTSQEPAAANFNFILANFSVRYLPYVMLIVLAVTKDPGAAMVAASGLVASHLYIFLSHVVPTYAKGSNIIATPNWVHGLFEGRVAPGAAPVRIAGTTGTTTARAPSADTGGFWRQRGSGHRLGSG
ncbi:Der1-like family-domain-containing protein [Peziza echinospora]|nr:Der1-like family-domain-containing protein [Peziza echinospora]